MLVTAACHGLLFVTADCLSLLIACHNLLFVTAYSWPLSAPWPESGEICPLPTTTAVRNLRAVVSSHQGQLLTKGDNPTRWDLRSGLNTFSCLARTLALQLIYSAACLLVNGYRVLLCFIGLVGTGGLGHRLGVGLSGFRASFPLGMSVKCSVSGYPLPSLLGSLPLSLHLPYPLSVSLCFRFVLFCCLFVCISASASLSVSRRLFLCLSTCVSFSVTLRVCFSVSSSVCFCVSVSLFLLVSVSVCLFLCFF